MEPPSLIFPTELCILTHTQMYSRTHPFTSVDTPIHYSGHTHSVWWTHPSTTVDTHSLQWTHPFTTVDTPIYSSGHTHSLQWTHPFTPVDTPIHYSGHTCLPQHHYSPCSPHCSFLPFYPYSTEYKTCSKHKC